MDYCYSCMSEVAQGVVECPHCHEALPYVRTDDRDLMPGTTLQNGRFIIGRSLGHGGFGITYIAYDKHLKTLRAIKEFYPGKANATRDERQYLLLGERETTSVEKAQKQFLHEARMMSIASLNNVENVVNIIDQFEDLNTSYIILEYLDGCTLDEYLKTQPGGSLPWEEAVEITRTVLRSLHKLHRNDLLHRDVSLSNIFRLKNGEIRLIDFGNAGRISLQDKDPEEMIYAVKTGYSPAEQINRLRQGPYTDVYAAGVSLFKMLVGAIPANSSGETLPKASKAAPDHDIPGWLDDALIKATKRDPSQRYQDAAAFLRDLEHGEAKETKKQQKKRSPLLIFMGFFAVSAGILLFALFGGTANPDPIDLVSPTPQIITPPPTAVPTATAPPTATPAPTATPEPEAISAVLAQPLPNEDGYIGKVDAFSVEGVAAPNQELDVLLNDQLLFTIHSDVEGNWTTGNILPRLQKGKQNAVAVGYPGWAASRKQVSFLYKPEVAMIALTKADIRAGETELEGAVEKGAVLTLTINGKEVAKETLTGSGFAFSDLSLKKDDQVLLTARDQAGNVTETALTVLPEDRLPLTLHFENSDKDTLTVGKKGVSLYGTAQADRPVKISLGGKDTLVKPEVIFGQEGTWQAKIDTSGLRHGAREAILAAYQDGEGNTATIYVIGDTDAGTVDVSGEIHDETTALSGQCEPLALVTLEASGKTYKTTADKDGAFSIQMPPQPAGSTLTLQAEDVYGNLTEKAEVQVMKLALKPIAIEGPEHLYLRADMLPYSLSGTAHPGRAMALKIGKETYALTADENGAWGYALEAAHLKADGEYPLTLSYEGEQSGEAMQITLDSQTPQPALADPLDAGVKKASGTAEKDAEITLLRGEDAIASAIAGEAGAFQLSWQTDLVEGETLLLKAVDKAGNEAIQEIKIEKALPLVYGQMKFPEEGSSVQNAVGIDAYVLCQQGDQARVVLEGEGMSQTFPMMPMAPDTYESLAKQAQDKARVQTGFSIRTRVNLQDYELPPGSYTVSLISQNADGQQVLESRTVEYQKEGTGDVGQAQTGDQAINEEIGYAFGFDAPLADSYRPGNVVLTAYFYAPPGAAVKVEYEHAGAAGRGAGVKLTRVFRDDRSQVAPGLAGVQADVEKAGCIFVFPIGKRGDSGSFEIKPTIFITLPDQQRPFIHTLEPVAVTIGPDGADIRINDLKTRWQQ